MGSIFHKESMVCYFNYEDHKIINKSTWVIIDVTQKQKKNVK